METGTAGLPTGWGHSRGMNTHFTCAIMLLLLRVQQQKESFGSLFRLPFTHNNEKSSNIFDSAELIVSDTYS